MSDWHEKKRREARERKEADKRFARVVVISVIIALIITGAFLGYVNR